MWLAQHDASRFKTHPISCSTLYLSSGLHCAICNCIKMLMFWMNIHIQLTAMTTKGSHKWNGKIRAKMPTSVINPSCHWIGTIKRDSSWNTSVNSYGYTMIAVSMMREHESIFMILSFWIQLWLASLHNSSWYNCTAGVGVHLFGSGELPSAHVWGKCLPKLATKWTIGGETTPVPSGIKSITPIRRQPAGGGLNTPARVSLHTVAMLSRQRLGRQAADSTN